MAIFTIEISDLKGGAPCPKCGAVGLDHYNLGEPKRDCEGDITHWEATAKCGFKITIFND